MPFNLDEIETVEISATKSHVDVEKYLGKYNRKIKKTKQLGDAFMYVLDACVFDPSHNNGDASIIQKNDGKLRYQCFHDSCKDKIWKDARKIISGDDNIKEFTTVINNVKEQDLSIESFLDTPEMILQDYNQSYIRIPFAGDNLYGLQTAMGGGLAGGRLYILGGIPSTGKTVLLNNIADNICLNNYPVLFFSYDDGRAELRYRTFARFSDHCIEDFNLKMVEEIGAVSSIPSITKIMPNKYIFQKNIPIKKWPELIEQFMLRHDNSPVIMVDYLRKIQTDNHTKEERLRVDDILGKLTSLAKDYNIPVVAISELARDSYRSGQKLSMASTKESGGIEYEASWLGILASVEEKDGNYVLKENWENIIEHDGNVDLIIFKAKRGTGSTGKIQLKVDKDKMTVTDRCNGANKSRSAKKSQFGF